MKKVVKYKKTKYPKKAIKEINVDAFINNLIDALTLRYSSARFRKALDKRGLCTSLDVDKKIAEVNKDKRYKPFQIQQRVTIKTCLVLLGLMDPGFMDRRDSVIDEVKQAIEHGKKSEVDALVDRRIEGQ